MIALFLGRVCRLIACAVVVWVATVNAVAALEKRTWIVDGVEREALVSLPAQKGPAAAPLVFVFHGHGGAMAQAARSFHVHALWPEALVVYPQGLPTPGKLTDPAGKRAGWQAQAGAQSDRDLKFFDAMLADLRKTQRVDEKRIYATGHSNGGAFTYQLWAERAAVFAAVAPSAALYVPGAGKLTPKSVLHVGSPDDELVKFSWQERMIERVFAVNGAGARDPAATDYRLYPGKEGMDVALLIHPGGHRFSPEAPARIVEFFQAHARSAERDATHF